MRKGASNTGWIAVRDENPSHVPGAVTEEEGQRIVWQSPKAAHSSQVICTSVFGTLRLLPDGQEVLDELLKAALPELGLVAEHREVRMEYLDGTLLGETGLGNPSNIDVYCQGELSSVCIEAKFLKDASDGFGTCSVAKNRKCLGHFGPGSAVGMPEHVHCRLAVPDGRRAARKYWELGGRIFGSKVLEMQTVGATCPLKGANFQLMRNLLFAMVAGGKQRKFGYVAIVPRKTGALVMQQVEEFRHHIICPEFQKCVGVATYDKIAEILGASPHTQSRKLGQFLRDRMNQLL